MRVALCQVEVIARRPDLNTPKIIGMMAEASELGAELAIFSEAVIPGYMVGDEWENEAFMQECEACFEEIRTEAMALGISVVLGTVVERGCDGNGEDGRPIRRNVAKLIHDHGPVSLYYKTNLASYREFDDKRYFSPGDGMPEPCMVANALVSTSICEDGWHDDYESSPVDAARSERWGRIDELAKPPEAPAPKPASGTSQVTQRGESEPSKFQQSTKPEPVVTVTLRSLRVPYAKPLLTSEVDVSGYLDALKETLLTEVRAGKRVQI